MNLLPATIEGTASMSASTARKARRKNLQEPATQAASTDKKCVLCEHTDPEALRDYGDGGTAGEYWMCADVEPCVARARATVAQLEAVKPETGAAAAEETAEVSQ